MGSTVLVKKYMCVLALQGVGTLRGLSRCIMLYGGYGCFMMVYRSCSGEVKGSIIEWCA